MSLCRLQGVANVETIREFALGKYKEVQKMSRSQSPFGLRGIATGVLINGGARAYAAYFNLLDAGVPR